MRVGCPHCSRVLSDPSRLESHLREDLNYAPFACGLCAALFHSKAAAHKHLDFDHPGVSRPLLIEDRDPHIDQRIQSILQSCPYVPATTGRSTQVSFTAAKQNHHYVPLSLVTKTTIVLDKPVKETTSEEPTLLSATEAPSKLDPELQEYASSNSKAPTEAKHIERRCLSDGQSLTCLLCGLIVSNDRGHHAASHIAYGEGFYACTFCEETNEDWPGLCDHILICHAKVVTERVHFLRAPPERLAELERTCFDVDAVKAPTPPPPPPPLRPDKQRRVTCAVCAKTVAMTGKTQHAASHIFVAMFTCKYCGQVTHGCLKRDMLIHIVSVHRLPKEKIRDGVHFADHRPEHCAQLRAKSIECFGSSPRFPSMPRSYTGP